MSQDIEQTMEPEECMSKIFEISGAKFEPDLAFDLWPKILQHKWLLSEKLGRDVGLRVACIDFLENKEQALNEFMNYKRMDLLKEMGALTISREIWDTISDSQPPKQLVQRRIILPLTQSDLSKKHGVVPPKTIIFLRSSGHREDSFRQGHSRYPVLVVYRSCAQYAHGPGCGKSGGKFENNYGEGQRSGGSRDFHRRIRRDCR